MKKKIKIKIFKPRWLSPQDGTKFIVVGYNNKVNGKYIEKVGLFYKESDKMIVFLDTRRFMYWLKRNVLINSKVLWALGLLGQVEIYGWKKKNSNDIE